MIDDRVLLRRYARDKAEDAFGEFVRRNLPLVYSAALRRLGGDTHRAEDVAQMVFCAAAREAQRLSEHAALTGWLYTATRNAVIDAVRSDQRRRVREQEAHMIQEISHDDAAVADWSRLGPVLDSAMDELSRDDRTAVLLRFFQERPFAEIGGTLGLSEDAARKRVERALDKLRAVLQRRGIGSTSAVLGTLLSSHAIGAVPASLASTITGAALAAGGATAGVAVITLTKLKVGLAAVTVAGGAVGLISQHRTIDALRNENHATQQHVARLAAENAALAQARVDAEADLARQRAVASASPKPTPSASTPATKSTIKSAPTPSTNAAATLPPLPDTPEVRRQKEDWHRRYAAFFKEHGMTAAQAERFVELKVQQAIMREDFQAAVRAANLPGDSAAVRKLRSRDDSPITRGLYDLLGPELYKAYGKYESYSAIRYYSVELMRPNFAAAGAALSDEQIEQMVQLISKNRRDVQARPTDIGTTIITDWPGVVAQSAAFLSPTQVPILEQFVRERNLLTPAR